MKDTQSTHLNVRKPSPFIAIDPFDRLIHKESESVEHIVVGDLGGFDVMAMKVVETTEGRRGAV